MSGVIIDGQQWERCNKCGKYVEIEKLQYEEPTEQYKYGRDLCSTCAKNEKVSNVLSTYILEMTKSH